MEARASTKLRDLALPLVIVAVVGMMIFPLPAAVLDALLMCNIAFALCLLISSIYISDSGKFTSLPTVLLLATLFRLGLNVSTTRQILSQGEAPGIIVAFGNFVVSGNLVVGVVVFSILTLVQFLVIAKGSERIAEVAARFTLDAMPGKQMAIDADVRAGLIGFQTAKEKRQELHRESKLYGALDGAMKFVKGDAIAGLIITLVNIVGGLVVGTTQQGLGITEALGKYTLFTIGDGLVSQIPALLVAVAAGVSVTRVEAEKNSFVGRELFSQLSEQPQAMATTGIVLGILSCVPGLPIAPFLLGSIAFLTGSYLVRGQHLKANKLQTEGTFVPKIYSTLVLRLNEKVARALQREEVLPEQVRLLRDRLFKKYGVLVPELQFDIDDSLPEYETELMLHGVPLEKIRMEGEAKLSEFNEGGAKVVFETQETCTSKLCSRMQRIIEGKITELIDDTHTRKLLELHRPFAEDLINSVIPNLVSVTNLTTLLRQLVSERVPIGEMGRILQAVSEFHLAQEQGAMFSNRSAVNPFVSSQLKELSQLDTERQLQGQELLAEVRVALRRAISKSICDTNWNLNAWVLPAELDLICAQSIVNGAPIDPKLAESLCSRLDEQVTQRGAGVTVILCSSLARVALRSLLEMAGRSERAIAMQELCEEVKINIVGELSLPMESESKDNNVLRPEFGRAVEEDDDVAVV